MTARARVSVGALKVMSLGTQLLDAPIGAFILADIGDYCGI